MATKFERTRFGALAASFFLVCAAHPASASPHDPCEPEVRVTTLEDLFGPTGNTFQGAIGIVNFESRNTSSNPAAPGYGLAVDDMVVEWREYTLVQDQTDCATSGACATISLDATNVFEGRTLLSVTVLDSTPYGRPVASSAFVDCEADPGNVVCKNDCNDDGDLDDVGDDNDCDNDGTPDVLVRLTSTAEPAGEYFALNRVASGEYRGDAPVSSALNVPGTLFVAPAGLDPAVVTATYEDHQDGTNALGIANKCRNDPDPAAQGLVQTSTGVFMRTVELAPAGAVLTLVGTPGVNGDDDGFADADETIDMQIRVRNPSSTTLRDVRVQISTNDPKIDCVLVSALDIGDLPPKSNTLSAESVRFKVAGSGLVNRVSPTEEIAATFDVTFISPDFDAVSSPQSLTLDLDLDVMSAGSGPTSFLEGFEGGLGSFVNENLDQGRHSLSGSDGFRCQYQDPDWINSNTYGTVTDCYMGATSFQADAIYWEIDTLRSYLGTNSLHYGINLGATGYTTPLAVLEAVRSVPIHLSAAPSVTSELSFKHQVSLINDRTVSARPGRSADRGVVMVRTTSSGGVDSGNWIKLQPYLNTYDQQAEDNYAACTFDPIDDGNTEDSFFDPTDPDRRLGPSSTCFPEFSFVEIGSTSGPFQVGNLGNASDGPGLQGNLGDGTWIESKVDLSRFRGRSIRLRFLATAIKVGTAVTYQALFNLNPDPSDDGWFIDDVRVNNTLTTAAELVADTKTIAPLPCGNICGSITVDVETDPLSSILLTPGQAIRFDASGTTADRCLDGTLQYRFCLSADSDCDGPGTLLLRNWTDNPLLIDAPVESSRYVVEARCSALPSCKSSEVINVTVGCPGGTAGRLFACGTGSATCGLGSKNGFCWAGLPNGAGCSQAGATPVLWVKGNFTTSTSVGTAIQAVSVTNNGTTASNPLDNTADGSPGAGSGFFYLHRKDKGDPISPEDDRIFCNASTWETYPDPLSCHGGTGCPNDRDDFLP